MGAGRQAIYIYSSSYIETMICPICKAKLIFGVPTLCALKNLRIDLGTGFICLSRYIYIVVSIGARSISAQLVIIY